MSWGAAAFVMFWLLLLWVAYKAATSEWWKP